MCNVSYKQVYNWSKKYNQLDVEGLKDNRGKRLVENDMTEIELVEVKVKTLENKLKLKERENIIKKSAGSELNAIFQKVRNESKYMATKGLNETKS